MTPSERIVSSSSIASPIRSRARRTASPLGAAPRHPVTGRSNFATSRSVKGASCSRASRTGRCPAAYLDPCARRQVDRTAAVAPEHPADPRARQRPRPPASSRGEATIGRANRAWALIGTSSSASTSGQTTGPPALNA